MKGSQDVRLNLDKVRARIQGFNNNQSYLQADINIHKAFSTPISRGSLYAKMRAVDTNWRANAARYDPNYIQTATTALKSQLPSFTKILEGLPLLPCPSRQEKVLREASLKLLGMLPWPPETRCNYVFATKFLHWCAREHFPPIDEQARNAIGEITGNYLWLPANGCRPLEAYPEVISAYNELLRQLTPAQRDQLVEYDYETQPEPAKYRNSIVRVFDKYLWLEGQHHTQYQSIGKLKLF